MPWEVEYTDDFGVWWQDLSAGQQDDEHLTELRQEGLIE